MRPGMVCNTSPGRIPDDFPLFATRKNKHFGRETQENPKILRPRILLSCRIPPVRYNLNAMK